MSGPRLSVRPSLSPAVYVRKLARQLPWPLEETGCRFYARSRHGI